MNDEDDIKRQAQAHVNEPPGLYQAVDYAKALQKTGYYHDGDNYEQNKPCGMDCAKFWRPTHLLGIVNGYKKESD